MGFTAAANPREDTKIAVTSYSRAVELATCIQDGGGRRQDDGDLRQGDADGDQAAVDPDGVVSTRFGPCRSGR